MNFGKAGELGCWQDRCEERKSCDPVMQVTVASGGIFYVYRCFRRVRSGLVDSARILQDDGTRSRGGKDVLDYGDDLNMEGGSKRDCSLFRCTVSFLSIFEELSRRPK